MEVIEIVADWLKSHGYDGLYTDECGCRREDLAPCASEGFISCRAGVYKPCDPATGFDFFIGPKEPTSDAMERENTSPNRQRNAIPLDKRNNV